MAIILGLIIGSKLLEENTDLDRLKLYNNIVVRSLRVLSAKLFFSKRLFGISVYFYVRDKKQTQRKRFVVV